MAEPHRTPTRLQLGLASDAETYPYRHDILAMVVEADPRRPRPPVTLCHWRPPSVRVAAWVLCSPDVMLVIKDFEILGTFFLPRDADISETLSAYLKEVPADTKLSSELLSTVMAHYPMTEQGEFVQFFTFPVYGRKPDEILAPGLYPVWKWIKPVTEYRKTGFWKTELHDVLEDGEWNGGKELTLLMEGVSQEELERVAGRMSTSLPAPMN